MSETIKQIATIATAVAPTGVTFNVISIVIIAVTGALTSWGLVRLVLWYCQKNRESVRAGEFHHETTGETVPRFGGVALAGTFVVAGLVYGLMAGWEVLLRRDSITVLLAASPCLPSV